MRLAFVLFNATALLAQEPQIPRSIAEYLGLTPAQVATFVRNLDEYYAQALANVERGNTVRAEIATEVLRDPIDSMALGLRFAELESMRREFREMGRNLIARHQALLTPAQAARLETIIAADRFRRVSGDAECLYLKDSATGPGGFCHFGRAGDTMAAAKSHTRQITEERSALERFLQLTPEQIARYRANQQEYNVWLQTPTGANQADKDACEALAASPLDPIRIGIPLARAASISQAYLRRARELIAANQSLLTDEQRLRLRILEEARALAPTVAFAESQGFLARDDGNFYFFFGEETDYAVSGVFSSLNSFWLSCHP